MCIRDRYNTEDESYGYKSKLKIADAVWVDNNLTLQEEFHIVKFQQMAKAAMEEIYAKGKIPVLVDVYKRQALGYKG